MTNIFQNSRLVSVETILKNEWCFNLMYNSQPLVYKTFKQEFETPYVSDPEYRRVLHIIASEQVEACLN